MFTAFLIILLIVSISVNVLLGWYIKQLFKRILYIQNNIGDLFNDVDRYHKYLEKVYQLPVLHGEPTVEEMLSRTKKIKETVKDFKNMTEIFEDEQDEEIDDDEKGEILNEIEKK